MKQIKLLRWLLWLITVGGIHGTEKTAATTLAISVSWTTTRLKAVQQYCSVSMTTRLHNPGSGSREPHHRPSVQCMREERPRAEGTGTCVRHAVRDDRGRVWKPVAAGSKSWQVHTRCTTESKATEKLRCCHSWSRKSQRGDVTTSTSQFGGWGGEKLIIRSLWVHSHWDYRLLLHRSLV